MPQTNILVVDDDLQIQRLVCGVLKKEGYEVRSASSLAKAREELKRSVPELIVLDRRLPDGDGLDFCRQVQQQLAAKPAILFLSSKDSTTERVLGLKMGGDDYLSKPFQIEELLARVEALLRRSRAPDETPPPANLTVCGISLNLEGHQCSVGGRSIELWPKEFELLQLFMHSPGKVMSKEFLSERIWEHDFFDSSRAIDATIQRLRKKLGNKGKLIETVRGYGFRLLDEKQKK